MKKRVVSLLLCLIMALSLIPTAAFATEGENVEETPVVEAQAEPVVETPVATDEVAVLDFNQSYYPHPGQNEHQYHSGFCCLGWNYANISEGTNSQTGKANYKIEYATGTDDLSSHVQVKIVNGTDEKALNANDPIRVENYPNTAKVVISVDPGYYVAYAILCCNDRSGYNCQTAKSHGVFGQKGSQDGSAVEMTIKDLRGNRHQGKGAPYYLMIMLKTCPKPVYVGYDMGLSGFTGNVVSHSDVENATWVNESTDVLSYDMQSPSHSILGISPEAEAYANAQGHTFSGWELTYYNEYKNGTFSEPNTNYTSRVVTTENITLFTHAKLVAQWTKVETPTGSLTIVKEVKGDVTLPMTGKTFTFEVTGPDIQPKTVTVPVDPNTKTGTASVDNLPIGKTYTVTEQTPTDIPGYKLTGTTYKTGAATAEPTTEPAQVEVKATGATVTVTNTYTKNTTSVTVSKEWSNDELVKNLRPESVTVRLVKNGVPDVKTGELNEDNGWTYTWPGLPMYTGTGSKITYSVEEVNVPAGYVSETVDVSTDNEPNNFSIINTAKVVEKPEIVRASLTVIKKDADNGALLKGAKFALIPEGGKATDAAFEVTDENGEAVFSRLLPGTYTLKEVTAPAGYQATDKTWTITVSDNAETAAYELVDGKFVKTITCKVDDVENMVSNGTITITNAKNTANLVITKTLNEALPEDMTFKFNVMKGTDPAIIGAEITIKAGETSSTAIVENLTVGKTYTVQEVEKSAQLDGYTVVIPEAQKVTISGVATKDTVTFKNVYTKDTGTLTISKVLKGDLVATDFDKPFTFTIWQGTEKARTVEVWPGNPVTLTLNPGKYTIVEDKADVEGYGLTTSFAPDYRVEVKAGEDTAVVATNTYTKTVTPAPEEHTFTIDITKNIELLKRTSRNPGKASFTFEAYMVDEQKNVTVLGDVTIETRGTKSASGKLTFTLTDEQLTYGATVYVREVEGNARGWTYDDTIYELKIGRGGEILTGDTDLTFTNVYYRKASSNTPTDDKTVKSVKTGDMGIAMYAMTSLLSLGGAALVIKKRKDEK